jgi:multidrug resistance efflux pump
MSEERVRQLEAEIAALEAYVRELERHLASAALKLMRLSEYQEAHIRQTDHEH